MNISEDIWIFRMIHYKNLPHILKNGFCTKESSKADPNYIPIGDALLIENRKIYDVPINPPNEELGKYIPFYFGPRSPMLYKIHTGNGVKQFPQKEIIYLCCKLQDIIESNCEWCFTDGHAKTKTTEFFNDVKYLYRVSKEDVYSKVWKPTADDFDCMRRKQAEFLVKSELNANFISYIVTYNDQMQSFVTGLVNNSSLNIRVSYKTKGNFYY